MADPPFELFYSYADEDDAYRQALERHLSRIRDENLISEWHFRQITAGRDWEGEVADHLNQAKIVLFLITANFLHSKYCQEEKRLALERRTSGLTVIPIIVEDCDWRSADLAGIQALPEGAHPVTSWPNQAEAWANVAAGIRKAIGEMAFEHARVESEIAGAAPRPRPRGERVSAMSLRHAASYTLEGTRIHWLEVLAEVIPDQGYIGCQTQLHFNSLSYEPRDPQDEVAWPLAAEPTIVRGQLGPSLVNHGALSGLLAPFRRSDYLGPIIRLELKCPELAASQRHTHSVFLLAASQVDTNGALYFHEQGQFVPEVKSQVVLSGVGTRDVADQITISCDPPFGS